MTDGKRSSISTARIILWSVVFLALGAFAFLLIERQATQGDAGAVFAQSPIGGPFTMTGPDGKAFTNKSLAGRPYAIFFGYTRCPDICPTTLARMGALRKAMGADGGKFDLVFVSVDPGHDKPADMARYAALFGTPVIGLTGTEAQVAQIAKAYHIFYRKVPQPNGDYIMDHSAAVLLVDAKGNFVTTIDAEESQDMAIGKLRRRLSS
mgnify:CR=1 FL=1